MDTRRTFLGKAMAIASAMALPSVLGRKSVPRRPIRVDGETPAWLIKGKPGVSYFRAGDPLAGRVKYCYFNGVEVSRFASEADTAAGWIRMFDVTSGIDGDAVIAPGGTSRIHFGHVTVAFYGNL